YSIPPEMPIFPPPVEGCPSGLRYMLGKHVGGNTPRGFESPSLCHVSARFSTRATVTKEPDMSKHQHLSVEDCYARGASPFRTVIMTAQEARFINEQSNLGFIKLSEKPTTIAIQKFRNNRLIVQEEDALSDDSLDNGDAPADVSAETPAA